MQAEIVSVGTELLLGEIVDTNATHIAQALREIGLDLIYMTTVGDNEGRIAGVIDRALDRVDVVITTGGLGPTVDDVTREAIARATGHPLEFQQELLDQIAERFGRFGVKMSENNRRQAHVPQGAIPIENPVGTAPIFILETERGAVMTLPGVPREMKYLLKHELLPWLKQHTDAPAVITIRTLRTAGIGESQIDARIGDLMTMSNPTVGLAAHAGQTDIRITAKGSSEEEAEALIAPIEAELRQRIGRWIYGVGTETVEEAVVALLNQHGATVASVEVGTHGTLYERLEQAAKDSPAMLKQGITLDESAGLEALGVDTGTEAQVMADAAAQAIRREQGTTYGVAVIFQHEEAKEQTGAAIAAASEGHLMKRYFTWKAERPDAHVWATTHALATLRRMILRGKGEAS
jgi:nicotinamide-nucleotide amidase